jgi:TRAP transporter 4TM/12TM fusion protein
MATPSTLLLAQEAEPTQPPSRALRGIVYAIAVAMSLYHMYAVAVAPPDAVIFRATHLLFALTLVFLLYPLRAGRAWRIVDAALLGAGWAVILYIFFNYDYFINRIIYIDALSAVDRIGAVLAVVVVLEATRRVIGWALPITALVFLVYAVAFTRVMPDMLMEQLYLSTEGIFGSTLGVSASYVMLFVLFGAFMEKSGTGQLFMDFALSITGHTAGGPGKVAVISSSLFGTVSGSAVANVMVDGPITIPLMKRTGFRPPFAAAVEAVASTGGQIMPPVMGAAAFVMAEFLAVPYAEVALWALLPALLYYVAVFLSVHFEAKRRGLAGVPRSELPRLGLVMLARGHLFIPIFIVLAGLVLGYSAPLCALAGALACLPIALLRATTRESIGWCSVSDALVDGARNTLAVAMACACAGIVIGCVTITGLGIVFTQWVVALAQNSLLLALVLTAIAGMILGMGMPTTPAYIVMVALLVPALIKLGATATGGAHVRVLFRDPVGDHAAGRARGVRGRRAREDRHVAIRLRGRAHRRAGVHRAVHVRLRAFAADARRRRDDRHVGRERDDRQRMPRCRAHGLPAASVHVVGAHPARCGGAAADQARLDHRCDRPRPARNRRCVAACRRSTRPRDQLIARERRFFAASM